MGKLPNFEGGTGDFWSHWVAKFLSQGGVNISIFGLGGGDKFLGQNPEFYHFGLPKAV